MSKCSNLVRLLEDDTPWYNKPYTPWWKNNKSSDTKSSSIKTSDIPKQEAKPKYTVQPTYKEELARIIDETIEDQGLTCDLNFIDTSMITDMSKLFQSHGHHRRGDFNGDISKWDVSNVETMEEMFEGSDFNGDISNWDVSNVTNMDKMFLWSKFNGDISKWNVSNVRNMNSMFNQCDFNGDISNWDVSNVRNMSRMFFNSYAHYNKDLSKWSINPKCITYLMFHDTPLESKYGENAELLKPVQSEPVTKPQDMTQSSDQDKELTKSQEIIKAVSSTSSSSSTKNSRVYQGIVTYDGNISSVEYETMESNLDDLRSHNGYNERYGLGIVYDGYAGIGDGDIQDVIPGLLAFRYKGIDGNSNGNTVEIDEVEKEYYMPLMNAINAMHCYCDEDGAINKIYIEFDNNSIERELQDHGIDDSLDPLKVTYKNVEVPLLNL